MKKENKSDFITWELSKRTIKIYENDKHVKNVPKVYLPIMDICSFNFDKKTLQKEEKKELNKILFPIIKKEFEKSISKSEKYVFEMINKSNFKGVRTVNVFNLRKRYELVYLFNNSELAVKCDKFIFELCPDKLSLKYSNF